MSPWQATSTCYTAALHVACIAPASSLLLMVYLRINGSSTLDVNEMAVPVFNQSWGRSLTALHLVLLNILRGCLSAHQTPDICLQSIHAL